jgi:hypothetical protein
MTAKSSGSERRDRLFLVRGIDDVDCFDKFRSFAADVENQYDIGLDIRTIKYLGDGPDSGTITITNESGVVELDTTNNSGYTVSVEKDV